MEHGGVTWEPIVPGAGAESLWEKLRDEMGKGVRGQIIMDFVSGRSSGEAHDNPLQNSCLENPMNRGAWWTTVQLTKSRTRLSDFQLQRLRRVAWKGQLRSQDPLFKALHLARKGPKWTREGY